MLRDVRAHTETCTLGDHRYLVGETWHPKLLPFGENTCVNCTCVTGGDVKCSGVDCPKPECKEPRVVRGHCCPTCNVWKCEPSYSSNVSFGIDNCMRCGPSTSRLLPNCLKSDLDNLPPTVRMEDKENDVTEQPGCEFHGIHYEDGDVFPSNKTALKPKHSNQCVLCACYRGDIICHLKTCLPSHKCRKTVKVDDDCCLQCEEASSLEDFTRLLSDSTNQTLEEGDCLSATGRQKNGSTWKPIIGQYGEMKCIVCTCINGQINCGRLQCREESAVKCNTSKVDPGRCCKNCTAELKKKAQTSGDGEKCRHNSSNKKEKKHCVSRNKNGRNKRNRNKTLKGKSKTASQAEGHLVDVLHKLCISDKTQHLVYHTKGNDFESLAFEWQKDNAIEYIYWTVKKGKLQNIERRLISEPDEYRNKLTVADVLGAVHNKDIRTFLKRLDTIQHRCKRKCKRKMLDKAIKKLRVQELDMNKSCDVSAEHMSSRTV